MSAQHAGLTEERWSKFDLEQQILMIANEMNRGRKLASVADRSRLEHCYERVLRLVDLTVQVQNRRSLRRELLRWRDLIARLYVTPDSQPAEHNAAFRCLLQLNPVAYQQLPLLL